MKKITKKLVITVLAAALVLSSTAVAFASGEIFPGSKSKGTFQFAEDGDASNPDIVISSDDLGLIYGNVTDGKTALAFVINDATADSKQPTSLGTTPANLPTFEDLQNAIDAVKSAGEDKAYKDIKDSFASDPDKADIYAGVEDLESLKNAITEDNNNSLTTVYEQIMTETKSFTIANGGEIYYSNTSGRVPVAFTVHGIFGGTDKGGYDLNGTYIKNFSNSGEYHWVTYGGGNDSSKGFQITVQYFDEYMTISVPRASTISVNCLY